MKMKFTAVIIVFLLLRHSADAQSEETRVKAGEDISASISKYGKYRFPQFRQGRLYYAYGKSATAKFNYNYLMEEMQFINPSTGDTLSVANPEQVKFVLFDSAAFYYNEGFMELVADFDSVKLARKQKLKITYEKIGAYGQPNTSSAIDNNKIYVDNNNVVKLFINQDAVIKKQISWYIIAGDDQRPVKADKAGFMKLYPRHTTDIKTFLKERKGGLSSMENLKYLLAICLK